MHSSISGYLREMSHEASDPIAYSMATDEGKVEMDDWLGRRIEIKFTGQKACIHCGRKVKKLYQSGYCFPCVTTLAECDLCIVKPHECHFANGTCRDESFGLAHCMIPHYVYLAFSSGVKVGLTRKGREFTRWMDQGASSAVLFAEVPTRKQAGELEMEIANFLPDKTDWRKMLREHSTEIIDLLDVKQSVLQTLPEMYHQFVISDAQVHQFIYPRQPGFEAKVTSLSLDKQDSVDGVLRAVKGQYLLLEHGVINMKKHAGYHVQVSVS